MLAKLTITTDVDIEQMRAFYLQQADTLAATVDDGLLNKVAIHALKAQEAQRVLAGEASPLLAAEAEATGMSVEELVRIILKAQQRSREREALIEVGRIRARNAIKSATSVAQMADALKLIKVNPS